MRKTIIISLLISYALAVHFTVKYWVHDSLIQENNEIHTQLLELRARFKGCRM